MASRSFNNSPSGAPSRSSRSSRRYSPTRDAEAAAGLRQRAGAVPPSSWTRTIRSYVPTSITTNLARLNPRSRQQQASGTVIIPIGDDEHDSRPRWLRNLPTIPSLSSLARAADAPADANANANAATTGRRGYTTVLEPFHPVDGPSSSDDGDDGASTGTSVPSPSADASPGARPPSSASTDADPDAYFLVHDAADVDADETYDPRRWAAQQQQQQQRRRRPQHPLPGERLWDGARMVREVALEAARVGVQVGAVLVSAGTADLVGDLAREVRARGARRRVGVEIMREQWLLQTGEGVIEDEQQWVDEDGEEEEDDEEEEVEKDEVDDKRVEDDNEVDEDEDEDVEIVTEGLTGPWVEQTGTGGGSPHGDEGSRPAKDGDSSVDGEELFFDAPEESGPSTSHSRSTSAQAASRSGQPTPSNRGAPSSTLPAATPQLTTAVHRSLVDAGLAAGFDILDEEDTRRPMWDLDDIAPYHRRPLHAYRRSQHTQRHRQHENAVARSGTSNATPATHQPQWMSASASRPATSPNSTPTTGSCNLGTRVLTRPPSPGSAGIAMISERPQNLPRSNFGRHNTRDNGRGDGAPTSSTNGSRR